MSESIYLIYKHTSPSGKSYIGQTDNLSRRSAAHKNPNNSCTYFKNAIQKYGWESFTHEILADNLTLDEANELEEKFILEHNTLAPDGYNLTTGGKNHRLSEDTKQKLREAHLGRPLSAEHKLKLSIINSGKILSEEHKAKISASTRGRSSPNKGKTFSDETKQKMRESAIANGCTRPGYKHSEETKRKMRESRLRLLGKN